jgi:glycosyltransferase involved in cell wall biosynthesis
MLPTTHADVQRRDRGEAPRAAVPGPPDRGVVVLTDDLPQSAYHDLFASCHVCVAVSRWEGLGLHLYEALGFGMPLLAVDASPVNEVVEHEVNWLLVESALLGHTRSGVESREPDVDGLAAAFRRLAQQEFVADLAQGVARSCASRPWMSTVTPIDALVRSGRARSRGAVPRGRLLRVLTPATASTSSIGCADEQQQVSSTGGGPWTACRTPSSAQARFEANAR